MRTNIFFAAICSVFITAHSAYPANPPHHYEDRPFLQDFAEKIPLSEELAGTELSTVRSDRNGRILVLSDKGLLRIHNKELVPDRQYRPIRDMQVKSLDTCRDQFVYLTDKAVLSNAWAGKLLVPHKVFGAGLFEMGSNFDFLLAARDTLAYFDQGKRIDKWNMPQAAIRQLLFDRARNRFLILSDDRLNCYAPGKESTKVFEGKNLSCLELTNNGKVLIVGTQDGYVELDAGSFARRSAPQRKLPCADIRCVKQIGKAVWFGAPKGAFALQRDGRIDYYASKRWLVDDVVVDISRGPDNSVLILCRSGLSIINFE